MEETKDKLILKLEEEKEDLMNHLCEDTVEIKNLKIDLETAKKAEA